MKNKKGQIEDVFADLFPAMLIITIALFIISTGNTISRDKIEMEIEGTNEYPVKVDMLTLLRSKIKFENYEGTFAEALNEILFNKTKFVGELYTYPEARYCTQETRNFIDKFFSDKKWIIEAYGESGENLFMCTSYDFEEKLLYKGKKKIEGIIKSEIKIPTKNPDETITIVFRGVRR